MSLNDRFTQLLAEGRKCVRQHKYSLAIRFFEKALEEQEHECDPDAIEGLATAYFMDNRLARALEQFGRITEADPRNANAHINMGAVCNRMGRYDEAISSIRKALQWNRRSSQAYYNLGIAYKGQGDLVMAISAYREAVRFDPEMKDAFYNLGNAYLEQGNVRQAELAFESALDIDPKFERAKAGLKRVDSKMAQNFEDRPLSRVVKMDLTSGKLVE